MHRLSALLVVAACSQTDRAQPIAASTVALAPASQTDLARELASAERLGTWRDVKHRWQGQTVRWTVTRQRLLCHLASDCNVAAFPIQRPARQGWMPQLSFAPGQYEILDAVCGSQDQCEVTIEGTLSQLDVSPELPTSVQLSNVRVVPPPPSPRTQTAQG